MNFATITDHLKFFLRLALILLVSLLFSNCIVFLLSNIRLCSLKRQIIWQIKGWLAPQVLLVIIIWDNFLFLSKAIIIILILHVLNGCVNYIIHLIVLFSLNCSLLCLFLFLLFGLNFGHSLLYPISCLLNTNIYKKWIKLDLPRWKRCSKV